MGEGDPEGVEGASGSQGHRLASGYWPPTASPLGAGLMGVWSGSCHCGAVRFRVEAEIDELTRCDCSLCRRKGALMAKVHESGLTIEAGEDQLTLYQWNTRIARHWFCRTCGIYTFHRKRAAPDHYGVNVGCLEDFDPQAFAFRLADGLTMSVRSGEGRPEWSGPRED